MKVTVDVQTRTFIRAAVVAVVFAAAVYLFFKLVPALTIIAISVFLAIALNPPVVSIAKRLPGKSRIFATTIAYLLVIGVLGLVTFLVIPPLVEQTSSLARNVPSLVERVTKNQAPFDTIASRYGLESELERAVETIKERSSSIAVNAGEAFVGGATTVVNSIITLLIVLVLTFLMLIEGPTWMEKLWSLYRNKQRLRHHRELVRKMYNVVSGYVTGQVIIALIAAVLSLIVVLILGILFDVPINRALPIAAIVFITTMIPMIGATIGAVIATLIVLLSSPIAALILLIYFVVYQQIENNLIGIYVQSKAIDISALSIFIAVFIGFNFFGILGALVAVPVTGCIRILLKDYLDRNSRLNTNEPTPKKT